MPFHLIAGPRDVIPLNAIRINAVLLNVIPLHVNMLNVIIPNVVEPIIPHEEYSNKFLKICNQGRLKNYSMLN